MYSSMYPNDSQMEFFFECFKQSFRRPRVFKTKEYIVQLIVEITIKHRYEVGTEKFKLLRLFRLCWFYYVPSIVSRILLLMLNPKSIFSSIILISTVVYLFQRTYLGETSICFRRKFKYEYRE